MKKIIAMLAGIFFMYAIIPTYIMAPFSKRVTKKTNEKGIMLTFDDGPNPLYTGKLLDLLANYHIKALFFVVASKAEKYPELINRMQAEGHVIGMHHYTHQSSFLLSPKQLKKQLRQSQTILQQLTGEKILFYRPPYGHFNLATVTLVKEFHVMTWSGMFGDWRRKTAETTLLSKLQQHVKDGQIYVLHDCGENFGANDDAPLYMLQALEQFLKEGQSSGGVITDAKDWANKYMKREASKSSLPS